MEYLAASGMESAVASPPEESIAERYREAGWQEACLLAVGARATDKAFVDRLFRRLSEDDSDQRWPFLLRCLKEEADFDDEQRAAILRGAGRRLLSVKPGMWGDDQKVVDDIVGLSIRHASWASAWIEAELRSATREPLQAMVAIRHHHEEEVVRVLAGRPDAGAVAPFLLDFGPESSLGRWAASAVDPEAALDWALGDSAEELVGIRSAALVVSGSQRLAAAFLIALTRAASRVAFAGHQWVHALRDRTGPHGRGLPFAVVAKPGKCLTMIDPGWPLAQYGRVTAGTPSNTIFDQQYFARGFARGFAQDFSRGLNEDLIRGFDGYFNRYLARGFDRGFDRGSDGYFHREHFARDFADEFAKHFAQGFAKDLARGFAKDFSLDVIPGSRGNYRKPNTSRGEMRPVRPDAKETAGELEARKKAMTSPKRRRPRRYQAATFSRQVSEAWAGVVTTVDCAAEERQAYVNRRMINAWLLNVWPAIDDRLDEDPSPDVLALYLALGWTQATTTWQWPATECWIALLGGKPPTHWLPRSQWHLCWLLHNPDDAEHRRALDEALAQGLADEERPQIAAHLRELFPERG